MARKKDRPFDLNGYLRDSAKVGQGFWRKVRRNLGRVSFVEEAVASYYCATDAKTPLRVKAVLMGALAYFVVPTDYIPDFIAVFGFTDDWMVLATAIRSVAPHIHDSHRRQARAVLDPEGEAAGTKVAETDEDEGLGRTP